MTNPDAFDFGMAIAYEAAATFLSRARSAGFDPQRSIELAVEHFRAEADRHQARAEAA